MTSGLLECLPGIDPEVFVQLREGMTQEVVNARRKASTPIPSELDMRQVPLTASTAYAAALNARAAAENARVVADTATSRSRLVGLANQLSLPSEPLTSYPLTSYGRWMKKPGVCYRQFDGEHFQLGLTIEVIESVLTEMLPWDSYKRDSTRFMDKKGVCWNTGPDNGYDLGGVVKSFLCSHGFDELAVAEILWSEGREGVGDATVFFSHVQKLPVEIALQTLREAAQVYRTDLGSNPRFFIDYFCIRQAQKDDFSLPVVRQAIHDTPHLLVELDDAKDAIGNAAPAYLTRSFCIFEVSAAVESDTTGDGKKVLVLGPAVKDPRTAPWLAAKTEAYDYNIVNSREAQCRFDDERVKINAFIEKSLGYEELDKLVSVAIANGVMNGLRLAAQLDPATVHVAAAMGVQAAELTDEALQTCCEQHPNPILVRTVDLQHCTRLTSIDSLSRFAELQSLNIAGCENVATASLVTVSKACKKLQVETESRVIDFVTHALCQFGRQGAAIDWQRKTADAARKSGRTNEEGKAHANIGGSLHSLGRFEEAIAQYKNALMCFAQTGDIRSLFDVKAEIGSCLLSLGHAQEAFEHFHAKLLLAQSSGDEDAEGDAHSRVGMALQMLGQLEEAIDHHKQALEIAQSMDDKQKESSSYGKIAVALIASSQYQEALSYVKSHLQIAQCIGNKLQRCEAYGTMATALMGLEQHEVAMDWLQKQLRIAKKTDNIVQEGRSYNNLGICLKRLGRIEEAMEMYEKKLKIAQQTGDKNGEGVAHCNIGEAMRHLGRYQEAFEHQQMSVAVATQTGHDTLERQALANIGYTLDSQLEAANEGLERGDWQGVINLHRQYLQSVQDNDQLEDQKRNCGIAHSRIGNAFSEMGQFDEAIKSHQRQSKVSSQIGDRTGESEAYGSVATALMALKRYEAAMDWLQKQLQIVQQAGDDHAHERDKCLANVGRCCIPIAVAHKTQESYLLALDYYTRAKQAFQSCFGPKHQDVGAAQRQIDELTQLIAALN
jgi:tetratricopeptide (TPR) repeat protein